MALTLDCSLSDLKVPGIKNYTAPFGSQKAEGESVSTSEANANIMLPYTKFNPIALDVSQSDDGEFVLDKVQTTSEFIVVNNDNGVPVTIQFTNAAPTTAYCKVTIFNGTNSTVSVKDATEKTYCVLGAQKEDYYLSASTVLTSLDVLGQINATESCLVARGKDRFLIFDFDADNHKSLKLLKNTHIRLDIVNGDNKEYRWYDAWEDQYMDMTDMIEAAMAVAEDRGLAESPGDATGRASIDNDGLDDNGRNFYLYLVPDGNGTKFVLSTLSDAPSDMGDYSVNNSRKVGQFHTLCADAGDDLTALYPAKPSSGIEPGFLYPVMNYPEDDEDGFFNFYRKEVISVTTGSYYDVVTIPHPLQGFKAGDILPESVWCITFNPGCSPDGMVYDVYVDRAVDIYMQSGMGGGTSTAYAQACTVSRQQPNHEADMKAVGKELLSDHEFLSCALGSNECTNVYGSSTKATLGSGGWTDTAGRRMISSIGCEDCCGFLWQWQRDVAANGSSGWSSIDGQNSFGQVYGNSYGLLAGGHYGGSAYCGSRSRAGSNTRSSVGANYSARASCPLRRGVYWW